MHRTMTAANETPGGDITITAALEGLAVLLARAQIRMQDAPERSAANDNDRPGAMPSRQST
ncbi:MAG: hypothetical protein ACU0CY_12765 [Maritimibacter harenae]